MDNMSHKRKVCVIGAGMCGLTSVKCMLDAGFEVTCFEINKYVGGRWHPDNQNSIPRTTLTNLPKFMSSYSDFPMPDNFPLYLTADTFAQYFEQYAINFGLHSHIKFNYEVLKADAITNNDPDGPQTSIFFKNWQWKITYKDLADSTISSEIFDFLIVSSGFYTIPYIPKQLQDVLKNFPGKILHSIDYTDANEFKDQNVLVCGLGNTGGDMSVEVSKLAKKLILSTTRGTYIVGRLTTNGQIPIHAASLRIRQYLPSFLLSYLRAKFIQKISNHVGNLEELRLVPSSSSSVIINDELLLRIASAKVEVKPTIERVDGRNVYFSNGTKIEDVNTIILCTGYIRKFTFLDDGIIPIRRSGKQIPLYKGMFLPNEYKNNIAFVGMFSIFGPVAATAEMQARYIAEVFKGNIKLPDNQCMEKEIDAIFHTLDANFSDGLKEYNLITDAWRYYDDLAVEIGCRPSLRWLFLTDPVLFWHMFKNYSVYDYRLVGPNKWNGARDAILNGNASLYSFMNGSRENPR